MKINNSKNEPNNHPVEPKSPKKLLIGALVVWLVLCVGIVPNDKEKSNNSSDQTTAKSNNKNSQESRNKSSVEKESHSNVNNSNDEKESSSIKSKDDVKESLEKSVNELKETINGSSSESKTNSNSSTDKTYNVGETVTINNVDYTLVSAEKIKSFGDKEALKISLHIKNNSNRKVYVSSVDVYNNQNQKVHSAVIQDMNMLVDIAPGKETTLVNGFDETNPGEYELQFQAGFKTVKYKFTL